MDTFLFKKSNSIFICLFFAFLAGPLHAILHEDLFVLHDSEEPVEDLLVRMAKSFAPEVRLHPGDPYRPASVAWYQKRCVINRSENDIPYYEPENPEETRYGEPLGQDAQVQAACYVNVVTDINARGHLQGAVLTYYFFYPQNGTTVPPFWGAHSGDWEYISLHVRYQDEKPLPHPQPCYVVKSCYYSAHRPNHNGTWTYRGKIPKNEATHPIVYSSWHGHANHPKPQWINAQLDQTADGGPVWKTWNHLVFTGSLQHPNPDCPWIAEKIRWGGPDAPLTPSFQSTWRAQYHQAREILKIPFFPKLLANGFNSPRFSLKGKVPTRAVVLRLGVVNAPPEGPLPRFSLQSLSGLPIGCIPPKTLASPSKPLYLEVYNAFLSGNDTDLVLLREDPPADGESDAAFEVLIEAIEPY